MRRVLCVWFPRLATECAIRPERAAGRRPVATVVHGGTTVAAVSEAAEAAGVRPGMGWGDARARCPSLAPARPDPEGEARFMRTAARTAERYGPWIVRGTDDLLVDVTGTAHLFGGERAMLEDCRRVFGERGRPVRAAVAGSPGAAWGLARFAARGLAIGSAEEVRGLPVEALRIGADTAARLRRIGLRRLGDLADRPRTALAERFGERLVRRLARMLGEPAGGSEPLGIRPPRPELRTRWEGMEPLSTPEAVEAVCAGLLETLCARLREGDLGARKMVLVPGFDAPAAPARRRTEVRAGRGLRDAARWLALLRERPGAFDPEGGMVRLDLAVTVAEPFDPAAGPDGEALWERLAARLGPRNVLCFQPAGSHRPEAAFTASPLVHLSHRPPAADAAPFAAAGRAFADPLDAGPAAPSASWRKCGPPPRCLDALAANPGEPCGPGGGPGRAPPFAARGEGNPRPLRLLDPPEPVGVETAPDKPFDPPAALRRRGRRVRLRWAEGPERIASEWWREDEGGDGNGADDSNSGSGSAGDSDGDRSGRAGGREDGPGGEGGGEGRGEGAAAGRDYWRVETEGGARLWLYRELRSAPRWFLHGTFA